MKPEILEIQPHELKFLFELKKQSSCSVRLVNKSDQHVAFKVKTTTPKKYCVRPNTGVIEPNSVCDFTVTMQAQKVAPPDLICKDKFLVQSTAVPEGTEEGDITSMTFTKEDGKYVEEKRLKVILVSPDSPVSSPTNGTLKPVQNNEATELKDDAFQKHSSNVKVDEDMHVSGGDSENAGAMQKKKSIERVDTEEMRLVKEIEEMKSQLKELELKLREAKAAISNLTEERRLVTQEKHFIQGELDLLRSKRHRAQVGFPLLFVCMVGLVSLYLGYLLHR